MTVSDAVRAAALVLVLAGLAACDAPSAAAAERQDKLQQPKRKPPAKTRAVREPAYGHEGDPKKVKRVIRIDMSDTMRFFPDQIRVKRGDTVRFVLRNTGQMPHEMVIGTMDELKNKAAIAKKNAEAGHGEEHAVHVAPGQTGRLVWQFTKPGEFHYACLVPGHFDAGMIGTIVVR